jgi:hypothetical protein
VRLLVAALAAAVFVLAGNYAVSSSPAATPNLQITEMQCDPGGPHGPGQFDLIKITNTGDASQDLTGWQLRSDPEETEQMSLTVAGVLDPGEQPLIIVAGPHSVTLPEYNMYQWSPIGVLREGEPWDYVKLFDPSGAMAEGLRCDGQVLATPTPTPEPVGPQATPTPAPPAVSAVTDDTQSAASEDTQNSAQISGAGQTSQQQVAGNVLAPAPDTGIGSLAPAGTSPPGLIAWAALALGALGVIAGGELVRRAAPTRRRARRDVERIEDGARGLVEPDDSHLRE